MRVLDCDEWRTLGQLYAFFGNSLLSPMNRTETVGLDPAFWHDLAGLLGGAIARPAQDCAAWAERAAGLAQCGSSNQFEDHMGIELLYLSELCRCIANAQASTCGSADAQVEELERFVCEHPLCWIGRFCDKVAVSRPDGYFVHVLDCVRALFEWQVA